MGNISVCKRLYMDFKKWIILTTIQKVEHSLIHFQNVFIN